MDTKTLNTYFHNKVLILNIILTFIIVLLHSQPLNRIGGTSILYFVMLKSKVIMIVGILGLVVLNMSYSMEYESIWHWLPVYLLGAYVGYNKLYMITPPENYQRKIAVGCIVVMVGLYAIAYLDDRRMFLFRFLSPVLVWALYDCFPAKWTLTKFKEKKWMHGLFFIYCTHFFIINIFQN